MDEERLKRLEKGYESILEVLVTTNELVGALVAHMIKEKKNLSTPAPVDTNKKKYNGGED